MYTNILESMNHVNIILSVSKFLIPQNQLKKNSKALCFVFYTVLKSFCHNLSDSITRYTNNTKVSRITKLPLISNTRATTVSPWSYGIVRDNPLLHVAPHHMALECSNSGWKGFHARYIFIFMSWSADYCGITTIITAKISCNIMLEIWDRKWHMFKFNLVLCPSIRNQTIQYLWKHHFPKSRIVITIYKLWKVRLYYRNCQTDSIRPNEYRYSNFSCLTLEI